MSIRVMSWVWDQSRSGPTQRLVLLAIADCANDRGTDAYPATSTLARKTGLSERGVRKAVAELEALGELKVDYKAGPRGVNRFRILMPDLEQGATLDPEPDTGNPEPDTGNPEQGATSTETRHDMPGAHGAGSTRHHVPGTRHETTGNPARGAPEPSGTVLLTEPSLEPSPATRSRARRPTEPELDRPDVDKICTALADAIAANGSKRPTITHAWRTAARLLLDKDGRAVEQVLRAIEWCQSDEFWRSNILSMQALRQHYDRLRLAAARSNPRPSNRHNGYQSKPGQDPLEALASRVPAGGAQ